MAKRSGKYNAVKTTYNGTRFDSKGEATLAEYIDVLYKANQVRDPATKNHTKVPLRGMNGRIVAGHIPDFFVVPIETGIKEVWEYKGVETADWKIKYQLWLDNHPTIPYRVFRVVRGVLTELHFDAEASATRKSRTRY